MTDQLPIIAAQMAWTATGEVISYLELHGPKALDTEVVGASSCVFAPTIGQCGKV